jgi:phage tail tape-measure protein
MPSAILKSALKITAVDETTSGINSAVNSFEKYERQASLAKRTIAELSALSGGVIGGSIAASSSPGQQKAVEEVKTFSNNIKGLQQTIETQKETGEMVGGIGGAVAGGMALGAIGTKIGAAIGTAIAPGIGTAIGAAVGFISSTIGSYIGSKLGADIGGKIGEGYTSPGKVDLTQASYMEIKEYEKRKVRPGNVGGAWTPVEAVLDGRAFNLDWWMGGGPQEDPRIRENRVMIEEAKYRRQKDYDMFRNETLEALEYMQRN